METDRKGDGCGWALVPLFPILFVLAVGALTGQLPGLGRPSESPPAVLAEQPAAAPAPVVYPTAQPVVVYPTAPPVVIYPTSAPVYRAPAPASDRATAHSAVVPSSSPGPVSAGLPPWAVALLVTGGSILGGGLVAGLVLLPWLRRRLAPPPRPAEVAPVREPAAPPQGDDPGDRASGQQDGQPVDVTEYLGAHIDV